MDMDKGACEHRTSEGIFRVQQYFAGKSTFMVSACANLLLSAALLIEKWRMRKAAYCLVPVLLVILLWRAEFCVLFDRFYHTMEYRNFLFTGMSFFLTGQILHEYQDKIACKRQEQWMQWGLKAGMISVWHSA